MGCTCQGCNTQVIFRCDLLPWAGLVGLHMLLERQISFSRGLAVGALAAAISLAATALVDSAFWGRWLWPEGEVFWFNTAENRCWAADFMLFFIILSGMQRCMKPARKTDMQRCAFVDLP